MAKHSAEMTAAQETERQAPLFLTLHGVPRHDSLPAEEPAYLRDPQGAWRPIHGDRLYDIEAECVRLHDAFAPIVDAAALILLPLSYLNYDNSYLFK
jgi:hypothetical protein